MFVYNKIMVWECCVMHETVRKYLSLPHWTRLIFFLSSLLVLFFEWKYQTISIEVLFLTPGGYRTIYRVYLIPTRIVIFIIINFDDMYFWGIWIFIRHFLCRFLPKWILNHFNIALNISFMNKKLTPLSDIINHVLQT